MSDDEIVKRVTHLLSDVTGKTSCEISAQGRDANLYRDIGMESIDMLDLVLKSEVLFGVSLNVREVKMVRTLWQFVELIKTRMKCKQ